MTKKRLQKTVKKLIGECVKDGKIVEKMVAKSINILKGLPKTESIFALSEFLKGLRRKEREHTMFIETATPLTFTQINRVKKIVEKKVKITKVMTKINPRILGGFKLRIGDYIWDESLDGKIRLLKEAIRG